MQTKRTEDYIPKAAVIRKITVENSQVKTFEMAFADEESNRSFHYLPGQFMMVSVPHHGEAPISFSSTPTRPGTIELSVRRAGALTAFMHTMEEGEQIGLRGPYGKPFPMATLEGRHLLFIAGGIGLAPLRSVINYCLDREAAFPRLTLLYGSRLPSDIAFHADLGPWRNHPRISCFLTVDAAEPGWDGAVGLVTALLNHTDIDPAATTALVCGPPMMIDATLKELSGRGFSDDNILTTMERHMKCGIGVCRHCHMDSKLVCVDGPVFSRAQLLQLDVAEVQS